MSNGFNPEIANVLPNGARILERAQSWDGSWVWLAHWEGHAHPYVTWLANADSPGSTYWGHYDTCVNKARVDFLERLRA
jgi:hypothetical protein